MPGEDLAWLLNLEVTRADSPATPQRRGALLEIVAEEFFSKLVYDGLNRWVIR